METFDIFKNEPDLLTFAAGQVIFAIGEPGDGMYAVLKGEVDMMMGKRVLETVKDGGIFGELALIDQSPRSAAAVAKPACRLARISEERFAFLVQQTPYVALQVMRVMAYRLRRET
ncbi:MAG: cyclic nucleotide-binding domain-containing protein [Gammaproteobacteria bacterium]